MANVNSTAGYQNLPAQAITGTTETALVVPAQGLYGGSLPSPTFAAGTGLAIVFPTDIAGSVYDGHPFDVTVCGKITTAGSITALVNLYQVPNTIIAAGTVGTLSNDHVVITGTATTVATTTVNFIHQARFIWDATSKILGGQVLMSQIKGVNIVANSGTAGTNVATTIITAVGLQDLNFTPSFTFGTANAGNSVTVTEFSINRA